MSGMPAEEGGAPPPQAPEWRDGVVGLADRSVDPDAASRVVGAALIALAGLAPLGLFLLYGTLDAEPIALEMLRAQADPDEPAATVADRAPPEPAILVILDGLRLDEAERLPSLERLRHQAAHGALRMPAPTRSRPMYHALFTGVPPAGSGVRSNRFAAPARLDTLTDRVRAAGGSVAFFAEGKDWLARMLGTPGDAAHADEDALGGRLDRSLEAREPATLRMLHLLAIDASAHDGGLRSPAHRRALRRADRFVDALLERWPGVLAIVSDHGHAEGGGHGGDEAEVSRVPWLLRAPRVPSGRIDAEAGVERFAPTLAAAMGLAPPRAALAGPIEGLGLEASTSPRAALRAADLRIASRFERARLERRRDPLLAIWAFVCVCLLGASKRAFGGLDRTLLAGPLWALAALGSHPLLLGRPLSLTAMDRTLRHGLRLALWGGLLALLALGAIWLLRARGADGLRSLRRGASAIALWALGLTGFAYAWTGLALGPWPLAPLALYLPFMSSASMIGAAAPLAFLFFWSAWRSSGSPDM